jgi:hypothetical protein
MAVKRYNGTSWDTVAGLGTQGAAATSSSITTWVKTATGGETSLTGSSDSSTTLAYTPGQEQFFINGVLQVRGSDYTATNGTSITGISALIAGDVATVTTVNAFSVTGAVPLSTVTANGDLIVGTSSGAVGRLGIGSTGNLLTVAGGVPTWAAPAAAPGEVWSLIGRASPSGSATTLSINVTGYKKIFIFGRQVGTVAGGSVYIRLNAASTNYNTTRNLIYRNTSSQFTSNYMDYLDSNGGSELLAMDGVAGTSNNDAIYNITVDNLNSTGFKTFESIAFYKVNTSNTEIFRIEKGIWANSATVTSIDFTIASGGNLNSGGIYNIYGVVA